MAATVVKTQGLAAVGSSGALTCWRCLWCQFLVLRLAQGRHVQASPSPRVLSLLNWSRGLKSLQLVHLLVSCSSSSLNVDS